jgi:salicylate hydroxylase
MLTLGSCTDVHINLLFPDAAATTSNGSAPGPVDVDVAIIGAGPGGLAAAIAFMKQGLTVRVFEKASVLRPAGSMVGIQPNGYNALKKIDPPVCEAVLDAGVEPDFFSLCNNEGLELNRTSFVAANVKRVEQYGAPFKWVFWYRLQSALLKFLPGEALVLGHRLERFEEDDHGVSVWFEGSDNPVHARLLVGADGGRSLVRQQLLGDGQPVYTGAMTWRGSVPAADVAEFGAEHLGFYWMMGGGATFAVVEQGDGELLWTLAAEVGWETKAGKVGDQGGGGTWATEKASEKPSSADTNAEDVHKDASEVASHETSPVLEVKKSEEGEENVHRALEVLAQWPEKVWAVVKATAPGGVVETGVYHRAPVERWCSKRVALVGDAAHIMRPTLGQGTSQAFEDALVLARELARIWGGGKEKASPEVALEAYMDLRRERVSKMQLEAAEVGKTAYKQGTVERAQERTSKPQSELDWKLSMPY